MSTELKIIGSGVMFLFTIGIGFWLSNSGKPYNTAIFNAHKLIALATVIIIGILMFNFIKSIKIDNGIIILIIVAIISVLLLFVSGALLSIRNVPYSLVKMIHIVATIVAPISIGFSIYRMLKM